MACYHTDPPSAFDTKTCPDYLFYKVRNLPQQMDQWGEDYLTSKIRFCRLAGPPVCRQCGSQNYTPNKPNFTGRYAEFFRDGSWNCINCYKANRGLFKE